MAAAAAAEEADWRNLPDDITRDIFARLLPSDPLYLFRVSHLCRRWRIALTTPHSLRLLHDRHVTPLLLGFLHDDRNAPTFVRTLDWPFSLADVPERRQWRVLDYRHGRALFLSTSVGEHGGFHLLVWDPISGDRRRVPVPPAASRGEYPGAALVCAVPGCNHRRCSGGHFQVALVANPPLYFGDDPDEEEMVMRGFLYSSEMDSWIEVNSIPDLSDAFGRRTNVLVGHSIYLMSDGMIIFEFDLAARTLAVIPSPDMGEAVSNHSYQLQDEDRFTLVVTNDGGLGVAEALDGCLHLSSWKTTGGNIGRWVHSRTLDAYDLRISASSFHPIGFSEGANTIYIELSDGGIFTFELSSGHGRTLLEDAGDFYCVFPVVSFDVIENVFQGPGGVQHNLPNANVDASDEDEDEEALELAQQLFDTGSNYIEQMDFVNAVHCLRESLEIRVEYYGKFATECASTYYKYGCALLYKARAVTDRIANVHEETPNEESVQSKYHHDNSKASGTNAEYAISLEKVKSDEGRKDQEYGMMAGDQDDSELQLSWEMLDIAREIVEKSPGSTTNMVHILSALDQVTKERAAGKESNSEHNVSSRDTDSEAAERGTKRSTSEPISREPSPKRHAVDP